MSRKQLSQTSFTTFSACASSLQNGLARTERIALLRTHSWCCCISFHWPLRKNSLAHRHSPLRELARIWRVSSASRTFHCVYVWPTREEMNKYLGASRMSQVTIPIQLKPQMVIRMYHLMCHRIFQMTLITHLVRAYLDTKLWVESACFPLCTSPAMDVVTSEISA